MLKVLRDNLKYLSWILWGVVIIFVLFVFADFGGGVQFGDQGARPDAAATVGGERITYADFQRQYRQLESRLREAYGGQLTPELEKQMQLPLQALNSLITNKVLLREADRMGLEASDAEVRRAILEMPGFQDGGRFVGPQVYDEILRSNGLTPATFERQVRQSLVLEKLQAVLAKTVRVADADLERAYRERLERARVRYLQLPLQRFQGTVTVDPQAVRAFYDQHREEFRLPEQRVVDYLLIDGGKLLATLAVPETELRAYYDAHQSEFASEEEVRARHILLQVNDQRSAEQAEAEMRKVRARLQAGEDFAAVAAQVSEDPGSKERGGDLGFFARGRMIKEFEDAAFGAQPGELVGPVQTSFGYHLLEVLERRPAGQRAFAEARPEIEARLRAERAQTAAEAKAKDLAQRLAKEGTVGEPQLRALADAEAAVLSVETTPPFGRESLVPGVGRATAFAAAAFELQPGKVSEPVRIPRGWAILTLRESKPPRVPEFAEVEAPARAQVERRELEARATAELAAAKAQIADGKSLDDVARGLGVEVRDSEEFGADGYIQGLGANRELAAAALALEPGAIGGPVAGAPGPVLFQVVERKRFDPAEFAAQRDSLRAELERDALDRLLGSLVEQRRQELKVQYDRQFLEQIGAEQGQAG